MCKIAKVSRSGYYNFINRVSESNVREIKDADDYKLIRAMFNRHGFEKGARTIKMGLELEFNVTMNLKKIRRLMKKFNLVCSIRKANPYKRMARALKTSYVADNILERKFKDGEPNQIYLTDITYLSYDLNKRAYLSAIKDAVTNELVAYEISNSLDIKFVIETMNKLSSLPKSNGALINSDQGAHYTSVAFQNIVKKLGLEQSMSRRGNCWDNAPIESFFSILKTEIKNSSKTLNDCKTLGEVTERLTQYIDYYNNYRPQWNLNKMTPIMYGDKLRRKIKTDKSLLDNDSSVNLSN